MKNAVSFTEGPILPPLLRFTVPVLLALFLQAMYGAVDLLVVGVFRMGVAGAAVATVAAQGASVVLSLAVTARRAMLYGMGPSLAFGVVLAYFSFFHGSLLAGLFTQDGAVQAAAADYLRAYAIDTLLTSIMFCFAGYFNGCGSTTFVMVQGIVGAFLVRVPVSLLMSRVEPVSLFRVGLATPCSTAVQILLFLGYTMLLVKKEKQGARPA